MDSSLSIWANLSHAISVSGIAISRLRSVLAAVLAIKSVPSSRSRFRHVSRLISAGLTPAKSIIQTALSASLAFTFKLSGKDVSLVKSAQAAINWRDSSMVSIATGPLRPRERFSIPLHGLWSIQAGERFCAMLKSGESVRSALSNVLGFGKCCSSTFSILSPVMSRRFVCPSTWATFPITRSIEYR